MYETLIYEVSERVATVTMNRPDKRNAVDRTMFNELRTAFEALAADPEVRAFVLQGAGDHFCSGADLSAIDQMPATPAQMLDRMHQIHQVMRAIFYCPKPGVAKVRGYAAGGGANLALACDIVVMSEDAKFAELFVRRGLTVDMSGSFTLPRAIGLHRAKELALLGDTIDAARAGELGIANRVVPAAELDAEVASIAAKLAAGPPIAMSFIKRAMNESFSLSFDEVLEQESLNQSILFSTSDLREAVSAFFEKRAPNFTGE